MDVFDDWQVMGEQSWLQAQSEYSKLQKSQIFGVNGLDYSTSIFEKIAYLRQLLLVLKQHNSSEDVLLVLDEIDKEMGEQSKLLKSVFEPTSKALQMESIDTKIFCNNLKLSVGVCLEIINLLFKYCSDNLHLSNSKKLNDVIESFFDICHKYVSLFGECQYRVFVNKYKK